MNEATDVLRMSEGNRYEVDTRIWLAGKARYQADCTTADDGKLHQEGGESCVSPASHFALTSPCQMGYGTKYSGPWALTFPTYLTCFSFAYQGHK